jgi:short-subunit dehydrogenase
MKPRPVALITGASSGIGHALAIEYARRGHDVVAIARRADRLADLVRELRGLGAEGLGLAGDVSVDGSLEQAVGEALDRLGRLDVVIANAGISVAGAFEKLTLEDFRKVFETNVFGVLRTAYATLPQLRAQRGSFAAVGSVSGFVGLPTQAPYAGSKFAVKGLCEALHHEYRGQGVSVTHIAPGFVESEIRRVDNRGNLRDDLRDPIPSWLVMPAAEAARQIADGIKARRREVIITGHGKVFASLARHTPGLVAGAIHAAGSRLARDKS